VSRDLGSFDRAARSFANITAASLDRNFGKPDEYRCDHLGLKAFIAALRGD
jgi:hypothetical protein